MSNQDRFMDDMHFCIEVLGMDDDAIKEMEDQIKAEKEAGATDSDEDDLDF